MDSQERAEGGRENPPPSPGPVADVTNRSQQASTQSRLVPRFSTEPRGWGSCHKTLPQVGLRAYGLRSQVAWVQAPVVGPGQVPSPLSAQYGSVTYAVGEPVRTECVDTQSPVCPPRF